MIHLSDITKDNLISVTDLQMEDSQAGYVEDNLFSIAECYLYNEFIPKAIYDDDLLIGFVLYYFVEGDPDYVFLHRIMIDKRFQGKGYGVRSIDACVKQFKEEFPSIGFVELIHYPNNSRAAAVYEKAGFHLTGGSVKSAPGRIFRDSDDPNWTCELVRRRYY
ncbi:MAG TPA: GNAT family N-acetyltransferase [Candidatus Fimisoma avicola]|uniref:GNAT family N-acetyltransferase n=1 Tax=Candidatus Fimisoma avicola TaxID=2840826 RepID=A0A9D1I585_9FIRM|nr:GNAT family N-acetyltransferase [Candidatus Fimisoma avicola]